MYRTKLTTASLPLDTFIASYQDREKFLAFCRECGNYETRWSCPPLSFDPQEYLARFRVISLAAVQLFYDEETRRAADTPEKIKAVTWQTLHALKGDFHRQMLAAEQVVPGSVSLSSGGCSICEKCTRPEKTPCRHPEQMRYSLDAFGFDLSAITTELLGIALQWSRGSLPEYYTLIHALLSAEDAEDALRGTLDFPAEGSGEAAPAS